MAQTLEPIQAQTLYPWPEFQRISGLGRFALANAQKKGLVTRKVGNRKFILGNDFIAWLESQDSTESAS